MHFPSCATVTLPSRAPSECQKATLSRGLTWDTTPALCAKPLPASNQPHSEVPSSRKPPGRRTREGAVRPDVTALLRPQPLLGAHNRACETQRREGHKDSSPFTRYPAPRALNLRDLRTALGVTQEHPHSCSQRLSGGPQISYGLLVKNITLRIKTQEQQIITSSSSSAGILNVKATLPGRCDYPVSLYR